MDLVIRVALLAPYALGLISISLNAWRLYVIYRDSVHRRSRDVSDEHRPISFRLAARAAELKQLGFHRLGELEAVLPAVGLVRALTRRTQPTTAWLFVDEDGATEAALVERMVEFSSQLSDGSFVETMHPIGESIDEPDLYVSRIKSSLSEAYRRHRAVLDDRSREHGVPRQITTMANQAEHDRAYRVRHARTVLRRPLIYRGLLPLFATGVFIAVLAWWSLPAIDAIARVLAR